MLYRSGTPSRYELYISAPSDQNEGKILKTGYYRSKEVTIELKLGTRRKIRRCSRISSDLGA